MTFQYATNTSSEPASAHERLSRMLDMGKYGERLAYEILDQHIMEWLASDLDLTQWIVSRNANSSDSSP